jgi:hypothetical protein
MPRRTSNTEPTRMARDENFRGDMGDPETKEAPKPKIDLDPTTTKSRKDSTMSTTIDPSEWNMDDIQEEEPMTEEAEYKLRIYGVRMFRSDSGQTSCLVNFEFSEHPFAKSFTQFVYFPHHSQEPRQHNRTKLTLRDFANCFKIDISGPFKPEEEWTGKEGWAVVFWDDSEKQKKTEYGPTNKIRRYL